MFESDFLRNKQNGGFSSKTLLSQASAKTNATSLDAYSIGGWASSKDSSDEGQQPPKVECKSIALSVSRLLCLGLLYCYGSSCTKAKAFY